MRSSGRPGWHDPNAHRPPRQCSAGVSATSLFRYNGFRQLPADLPADLSLAFSLDFRQIKLIRVPVKLHRLIRKQAVIMQQFAFPPRCTLLYACDTFRSKVERGTRQTGAKMRVELETGYSLHSKVLSFGSKFSKS